MKKNEKQDIYNAASDKFYTDIKNILEDARKKVKTAINLSMVYAYFEIGKRLVEEEQNGENRAEYGKRLIQNLSGYLTENFGRGYSVTNLKQMRKFYKIYSADQKGQTLSDQFSNSQKSQKISDQSGNVDDEGEAI